MYNVRTIEKHPDLDGSLTAFEIQKKGIKIATGPWTTYEIYLLFLNIKKVKEMFNIENFRDYYINSNPRSKEHSEIVTVLSENILRPRKTIREKANSIFRQGNIIERKTGTERHYTEDDVKRLMESHKKHDGNWCEISQELRRPVRGLQTKYKKVMEGKAPPKIKQRHFRPEEDAKIIELVNEYKAKYDSSNSEKKFCVPWKELCRKMGSDRNPISLHSRYKTILVASGPKMSPPERDDLAKKVLRLLVELKVTDLIDVDWEKTQKCVNFKGTAIELKQLFKNVISAKFNTRRGTKQIDRFTDQLAYLEEHY